MLLSCPIIKILFIPLGNDLCFDFLHLYPRISFFFACLVKQEGNSFGFGKVHRQGCPGQANRGKTRFVIYTSSCLLNFNLFK